MKFKAPISVNLLLSLIEHLFVYIYLYKRNLWKLFSVITRAWFFLFSHYFITSKHRARYSGTLAAPLLRYEWKKHAAFRRGGATFSRYCCSGNASRILISDRATRSRGLAGLDIARSNEILVRVLCASTGLRFHLGNPKYEHRRTVTRVIGVEKIPVLDDPQERETHAESFSCKERTKTGCRTEGNP